ncbi:protein PSK SIMULATOR 1 isoform X2 [Glycine max]|uniref:protein PSK SIMULATOR 1 isoform X2 n=1 Tax=Glycine max TaxID=3847 RepID=UPI001B354BF7|nr:protein PSK SIMULATOR 1 isoform X2 [Glycine max]
MSYTTESRATPRTPCRTSLEVSLRLGKAGTTGIAIGLEKAVEVLDTLGSSMTNLNASSGFVSGAAIKGNEISILAFEVANTIVKGFNLLQSLSAKSIRHLKEEVLLSHAVQDLVSKDMDELLRIVAADKRQELKVFSDEVIRFGNRSKNPQWHNLERYFEKVSKELNGQRLSRDEAEAIMQQLMTLVQFTAELYHELHALDRFEQDIQRKGEEEEGDQRGDGLAFLRAEIKSQKKQIRHLKKKSLWSRSLEEVMEKLVDIVHFLYLEISNAFGNADDPKPFIGRMSNRQRLGPAGLALHYANIVLQIDTLVARSSIPANTKDALYQSLPPNIKLALHSKLPSLRVVEELTIADITDEMEKTLHWLSPMATNTSKAHHGFGWVGEWANTGSEVRKTGVMRIETFHHADKDKVEYYILELLLWLHRLAIRSKAVSDAGKVRPAIKSPVGAALQKTNEQISLLTIDEQNMLQDVNKKIPIRRISKSLDFDCLNIRFRENCRLTKSRSHSSCKSKEITFNRIFSKLPVIDFDIDKERALNVIDRLDVVR